MNCFCKRGNTKVRNMHHDRSKYKCLLLGGSAGKSALIRRFLDDKFVTDSDVDDPEIQQEPNRQKPVVLSEYGIVCEDIEFSEVSTEVVSVISEAFLENRINQSDGFVCLYDVGNAETFHQMNALKQRIRRIKGYTQTKHTPIMLVGNKIDLEEHQVTTAQGEEKAKLWGLPFMETSAKTSKNVNELFREIVKITLKYKVTAARNGTIVETYGTHAECDCCTLL